MGWGAGAMENLGVMAGLQEPPSLISAMLRKWQAGYENIYALVEKRKGSRVAEAMEFESVLRNCLKAVRRNNRSERERLLTHRQKGVPIGTPPAGNR